MAQGTIVVLFDDIADLEQPFQVNPRTQAQCRPALP